MGKLFDANAHLFDGLYYRTDGYYYYSGGSWLVARTVPGHVISYHRPVHRTRVYRSYNSRPTHRTRVYRRY